MKRFSFSSLQNFGPNGIKCWRRHSTWIPPPGHKTDIQIYNPITKEKSPLILRDPKICYWYTCGPTVYDSAHIGHASSYVRINILQRILKKYFHLNLITAMNITDIDDKIIKRSHELKVSWQVLATKYETEFWMDLGKLNVAEPDILLRVTKNVGEIVKFIQEIVGCGKAYQASDGSVYFRTKAFKNYGKLQQLKEESPSNESFKENEADFALWKSSKNRPDEPSWDSPWGRGRPGWHIECSTLATQCFGSSITFHAGGLDLKFPHHENEEAQSCVYHKTDQWVDYWIHTGQLRLKGDENKMSKSLKNTKSIQELLDNSGSSNHFRMLCLLTKYRSTIEFDEGSMLAAKGTLNKFSAFFDDCRAYVSGLKPSVSFDASELIEETNLTQEKLLNSLKDDFNTPKFIEHLLGLTSKTSKIINSNSNSGESNIVAIQNVKNFIQNNLENVGFEFNSKKLTSTEQKDEALIQILVEMRRKMRIVAAESKNKKLYDLGDEIRRHLQDNGVEIKDHGQNSSWNYK